MKECIVVVVPRGEGCKTLSLAREAGAAWGVVLYGRSNSEVRSPLFGIPIHLPKEVLLILCDADKAQSVFDRMINQPAVSQKAIAFSVQASRLFDPAGLLGRARDRRSACILQAEEGRTS